MKDSNWAMIFTTKAAYRAEIAKDVLEDAGITCVLINKQDTAYGGVFGSVEVYVQRENVLRAKHLMENKAFGE